MNIILAEVEKLLQGMYKKKQHYLFYCNLIFDCPYKTFQLKLLSIEEVLSATDRWFQRKTETVCDVSSGSMNASDPFSKLWAKPICSKVEQALCDYGMIHAARCELKLEIIKNVVSKWLRLFPVDVDSNLDIEVEKYVSLGGKTAQIYEIGYQLYSKVYILMFLV